MKTTEGNVRQRLKLETAESHQRLDDMMSSRGPFDSTSNYQWYLTGMHALYLHCEASILWAERKVGLETHQQGLIELIESDLATISGEASISHSITADRQTDEQAFDDASHWARAYVMEGSAIGASFMIRGARKS